MRERVLYWHTSGTEVEQQRYIYIHRVRETQEEQQRCMYRVSECVCV
jgi:hypothetical protein